MSQDSIFLQFSDEIQEKLKSLNITTPTSVQQNVIPTILENKNGVIKEYTNKPYIDYIACEDYNESVMLAAHIHCR